MPTFYVIFAVFLAYWFGKKRGKVVTVYNRSGVPSRPKEEFRVGQIVFVSRQLGESDWDTNMITQVLDVDTKHATVQIRTRGSSLRGNTTCYVPAECLTVLPVDQNYPLQFPGRPEVWEPAVVPVVPGKLYQNIAAWTQVPIDWFNYYAVAPARIGERVRA